MDVTGATSTSGSNVVAPDKQGFNGLTSTDFLKLLIEQLKNQDPTAPVGNEELLNQISTMRSMQSNIELSATLKQLSSGQQVSSGASYLGKVVTGLDANKNEVTGVADRFFVADGKGMIGIGEKAVAVADVTGLALP